MTPDLLCISNWKGDRVGMEEISLTISLGSKESKTFFHCITGGRAGP
jgi:hypothetical protein